ncbi:nicotinamide-nucleotide adenylyltransferase [mine drainage metagenome]|uniref:Nicotinamide-nucleotide adenylyltransferase n=1 Tax=mine drainage metagenome TaxID=410659 RepID=T1BV39_9ZZZZ
MARGLYVGRFQPFHRGHLETIRAIRAGVPREDLIVGVGSAQDSYQWNNPFTAGERVEMIGRALDEARIDGCMVVPIIDIHRHAEWVAYLEGLLPVFDRIYTNNPLTRLLFEQSGYTVTDTPLIERDQLEGTRIRARIAEGQDVSGELPPAVVRYLDQLNASARLALLRAERNAPPPGGCP